MDINILKEEFSYAYIYAVVSAAGYSCQIASRPMDIGGIDIVISGQEKEYSLYPPRLEIQVKSTSTSVIALFCHSPVFTNIRKLNWFLKGYRT